MKFSYKKGFSAALLLMLIYNSTVLVLYGKPYDPGGLGQSKMEISSMEYRELILMEPNICSSKGIIIVHSHCCNRELRNGQRKAWSQSKLNELNYKRIFILFLDSSCTNLNLLQDEFEKYNDIVVVNLEENYRNLSYKHVIGLTWAVKNCDNMTELIKMDDDIFVHLPAFLERARKNKPINQNLWMLGRLQVQLPVIRDSSSKWFVTKQEFNQHYFPDFLSGWLYLTNKKTVINILQNVLRCYTCQIEALVNSVLEPYWMQKVFWIDDVWLTGIIAEKANIQRLSLNSYYSMFSEPLECCVKAKIACPFLVAPIGDNVTLLEKATLHYERCSTLMCPKYKNYKEKCLEKSSNNVSYSVSIEAV